MPVFLLTCLSAECSCGWVCVGLYALGSGTCLVQGEWPKEDAIQHQQLSQWEYTGEEILQGAATFEAPLWSIALRLGHCGGCLNIFPSHWRNQWLKDNVVSSWLMVFMSGGGRKNTSSPSLYTSLRPRDSWRRKQRFRMTPWPQLAIQRMRALQRPPLTWERFVLAFL